MRNFLLTVPCSRTKNSCLSPFNTYMPFWLLFCSVEGKKEDFLNNNQWQCKPRLVALAAALFRTPLEEELCWLCTINPCTLSLALPLSLNFLLLQETKNPERKTSDINIPSCLGSVIFGFINTY